MSQCPLKLPFEKKKKLFDLAFSRLWWCKTFWVALYKLSQAWGFPSSMCWCIPLHCDLHNKTGLDKIIEFHLFVAEMKEMFSSGFFTLYKLRDGHFSMLLWSDGGGCCLTLKNIQRPSEPRAGSAYRICMAEFSSRCINSILTERLMQKKKRLLGIDQDGGWGI